MARLRPVATRGRGRALAPDAARPRTHRAAVAGLGGRHRDERGPVRRRGTDRGLFRTGRERARVRGRRVGRADAVREAAAHGAGVPRGPSARPGRPRGDPRGQAGAREPQRGGTRHTLVRRGRAQLGTGHPHERDAASGRRRDLARGGQAGAPERPSRRRVAGPGAARGLPGRQLGPRLSRARDPRVRHRPGRVADAPGRRGADAPRLEGCVGGRRRRGTARGARRGASGPGRVRYRRGGAERAAQARGRAATARRPAARRGRARGGAPCRRRSARGQRGGGHPGRHRARQSPLAAAAALGGARADHPPSAQCRRDRARAARHADRGRARRRDRRPRDRLRRDDGQALGVDTRAPPLAREDRAPRLPRQPVGAAQPARVPRAGGARRRPLRAARQTGSRCCSSISTTSSA